MYNMTLRAGGGETMGLGPWTEEWPRKCEIVPGSGVLYRTGVGRREGDGCW